MDKYYSWYKLEMYAKLGGHDEYGKGGRYGCRYAYLSTSVSRLRGTEEVQRHAFLSTGQASQTRSTIVRFIRPSH
jgi:hypothetical protein